MHDGRTLTRIRAYCDSCKMRQGMLSRNLLVSMWAERRSRELARHWKTSLMPPSTRSSTKLSPQQSESSSITIIRNLSIEVECRISQSCPRWWRTLTWIRAMRARMRQGMLFEESFGINASRKNVRELTRHWKTCTPWVSLSNPPRPPSSTSPTLPS